MATGVTKRHSRRCRSRDGGRCNCQPTYEAWVYLPSAGKKVRKTFAREAEAKSWRGDAVAAANRGALRPTRRDARRLADALSEFVEGMKAGTVRPKNRAGYKPNTVRSYERAVNNYIEPSRLGAIRVADVQPTDVQSLVDELLASGLAAGTVSNILNPVQAFYRRAIDRGALAYNPAERLDVPAQANGRPRRIASPAQAAALIAALPEIDRPLWATAFYAGLRRGELQALRACDIDLGASVIRVERGWDAVEGAIDPKSPAARRVVPLLAVLRDFLDQHKLATGRRGEALMLGRTGSDPFSPMTIGKRSRRAWQAAKLDPFTLHECRHTFASLLIDSGTNPKAVQEFMGHSKIQTTFDIYGHLFPGTRDEVRERMDAYLGAAAESANATA